MGEPPFRDGDWYCESCGDHQFERNLSCRKCGAPKPMVSSNNQASKAGDWICPNPACKDLQFERNVTCRKCGTPRPFGTGGQKGATELSKGGFGPAGTPTGTGLGPYQRSGGNGVVFAPEDWMCLSCGDHQFAKNVACRRCGAPKPPVARNTQVCKPGDWICPNQHCKDLQFERNSVCRRCGTPKPKPGAPGPTPGALALPGGGGIGNGSGGGSGGAGGGGTGGGGTGGAALRGSTAGQGPSSGQAQGVVSRRAAGGAAAGALAAPEDWICPNCGDHQFARNLACRKCSAPKPTLSTNNQAAKMGDWICPNPACRDVQFERNQACRRCGTPKPVAAQARQQSMGGASLAVGYGAPVAMSGGGRTARPGDWVCPNPSCKDIQFEKNPKCRLCGEPKPVVSSNKQVFKAGDWICPNPACKDVQFERNMTCRQCGTAKPDLDDEGAVKRERSRSPAR